MPESFKGLGITAGKLRKKKDFNGTKKIYEKMLILRPDYAPTWCNLGTLLTDMGDLKSAVNALEKAIVYNRALDKAWRAQGNARLCQV